MAYEQVSQTLDRLSQVSVPTATVWTVVERQGHRLAQHGQREAERVGLERTRWEQSQYAPRACKGISLDGGMVYIRQEGWKELKAGVVGDIEREWTPTRQAVHLTRQHYTAVIGAVERFSAAFWALAVEQQVPYAGQTVVTADGAAWIWRLTADLFPCSVQIVDWYHATQHLAQAAEARGPTDAKTLERWLEHLRTLLYHGLIDRLTEALEAVGVGDYSPYFRQHQRRMQYQEFWDAGYPIGSGAIESGVKGYKQRFCGPGMRWSRLGAERMTVIRSALLSDDFDRLWDAA